MIVGTAQGRGAWRLRLVVAGVALALAACGTTVPDGRYLAAEAEPGLGADGDIGAEAGHGSGQDAGADSEGLDATSDNAASPAATGGNSDSSAPASGPAGGSTQPATDAPSGPSRGVTESTITIGVTAPSNSGTLAGSLGIAGGSTISTQAMTNAVVADINSNGGMAGRRLEVYYHGFDVTAALADPARAFGAMCSDFRDDHPVFAIFSGTSTDDLVRCSAAMGSPLILGGSSQILPASAYTAAGGGYLYGPTSITSDRLANLFVESLVARSFLETWNTTAGRAGNEPVKLGLIHADTPGANAMYASYTQELASHGYSFAETVTYGDDIQAAIAATQSAILKFRTSGVTHVFGASAFFLRFAEAQGYRPRYAYLPGLGQIGVENSPVAQLNGAMTVGWAPSSDVPPAQAPPETAAATHCRSVMEAAGLSTTERSDRASMYAVCDALYSMRDALAASGEASVAGLRRGYESLGSGFAPALTFPTSFGPNKHAGIDSVRDMIYDRNCTCFRYTSENRT